VEYLQSVHFTPRANTCPGNHIHMHTHNVFRLHLPRRSNHPRKLLVFLIHLALFCMRFYVCGWWQEIRVTNQVQGYVRTKQSGIYYLYRLNKANSWVQWPINEPDVTIQIIHNGQALLQFTTSATVSYKCYSALQVSFPIMMSCVLDCSCIHLVNIGLYCQLRSTSHPHNIG